MFRLIIAGGRKFNNYQLLKESCDYFLSNIQDQITIISGHANGADKLGERYAFEKGYNLETYPADWNKFGKRAGFIRNEQMACVGNACVCFWDGTSPGTKSMINICKKKELPYRIIYY